MKAIESAPGELSDDERAHLREAADDLLFSQTAAIELRVQETFNEARALSLGLARAGRWPLRYAHQVVSWLEACGPADQGSQHLTTVPLPVPTAPGRP